MNLIIPLYSLNISCTFNMSKDLLLLFRFFCIWFKIKFRNFLLNFLFSHNLWMTLSNLFIRSLKRWLCFLLIRLRSLDYLGFLLIGNSSIGFLISINSIFSFKYLCIFIIRIRCFLLDLLYYFFILKSLFRWCRSYILFCFFLYRKFFTRLAL